MTDQVAGTERRSLHNRRTALILLSIALAFFGGVIAKYWLLATV
ncbi:MAG TPA: cytochrome oxidase small assembly protein [Burkholderiaceae bacterium]|nr:cytochrome oxidase small assembly protein [Burkholderiaceae bacterium]